MKNFEYLGMLGEMIHSRETLIESRLRDKAFTRKRSMSFADALCFMLDMRKTTIQTRLNMYFDKGGGDPISQQAFSKLRMNFDHSPFVKMVRKTVKKEYSGDYELPLWHGFHVFGIDGSFLQLPREDELYKTFGIHGRLPQCPNAGISVLFDVLHGWAVDPVITGADMNERHECENHVRRLCEELPHIAKKSIVVMDRGYRSKNLIAKLTSLGIKFVMRTNSRFTCEVNGAPMGDTTVTHEDGMELRVVKFSLPNGETETLITNLCDISESLFPELYALRWGIETAYFKLKRELCVEKFSGRTVNSVYQDFWASMVLLNAVAVFQKEADTLVSERISSKKNKHSYRARTSDLIITLRDRFVFAVLCGNPAFALPEMENVIKSMARSVTPIRPSRSFPRKHRPFSKTAQNLKSSL